MEKIANRNPAIRKTISIEEIIKKDANERRLCLLQEKARMALKSSLEGAEARGESRGIEKRITEKQKEIVQNMLKLNLDVGFIQQVTACP